LFYENNNTIKDNISKFYIGDKKTWH